MNRIQQLDPNTFYAIEYTNSPDRNRIKIFLPGNITQYNVGHTDFTTKAIGYILPERQAAYLGVVTVGQESLRRGIGSTLVRMFAKEAREGFKAKQLHAELTNLAILSLWNKVFGKNATYFQDDLSADPYDRAEIALDFVSASEALEEDEDAIIRSTVNLGLRSTLMWPRPIFIDPSMYSEDIVPRDSAVSYGDMD